MSKLSELVHKLMGSSSAAAAPSSNTSRGGPAGSQGSSSGGGSSSSGNASSSDGASPAPAGSHPGEVDIATVLNGMAAKNPEKLDWRRSIVDLMKLVGMDSSLASRKELAKELGYTGDTNDSATMNIWLHKQVMQKVAANGGRVPDELK